MKVLLLSYGMIDYDGRLMGLHKIAQKLGDVTMLCCSTSAVSTDSQVVVRTTSRKYRSIYTYMQFVAQAVRLALKTKVDLLFVDNYLAATIGLLIQYICRPKFIVQDVRELYLSREISSWKLRLLVFFESKLMKVADVVLCANEMRAEIMYEYHQLRNPPLVFENIRALEGYYDELKAKAKYSSVFKHSRRVICTGGVSLRRGTDKLVKAMKDLPDVALYIVGGGDRHEVRAIEEIIRQLNLANVCLIEKVPLSELRYLVRQCHVGIVHYHKNDLNNKYCASGKVYEYLFEGLPIVTTENPPLVEFCRRTKTGVADDGFRNGIIEVLENLPKYRDSVRKLVSSISVDNYHARVAEAIRARLLERQQRHCCMS